MMAAKYEPWLMYSIFGGSAIALGGKSSNMEYMDPPRYVGAKPKTTQPA